MNKLFKVIFLLLMFVTAEGFNQNNETDSLINLLAQFPDDTSKVDNLNRISYNLFTSDPPKAVEYGKRAEELAEKLNYSKGLAYSLKNIGLGYYMQGEFLQVLDYWNHSLKVFRSIHDLLGEANMLNNLGAIYYNQGDDARAIDFYLQSLSTSERINDTLRIATALINVGGVYFNKVTTRDKALKYYLRALPLGESLKDKGVIGTTSLNLGDLYLQQGKDSLALYYFEKSKEAWEGTGRVPNPLSKIGVVYAKRGEYKKAVEVQQQAIEIARQFDAKLELTRGLLALAKTYDLMKERKLALETYQKAKTSAVEMGANYELKDAYEGIANAYANLSDFMDAYKYQKLLLQIKDTLFNIETDDKIKGLQFTYEIEKKQGQIDLLTKDKELQALRMKRQKMIKNTFLGGLIVVFIIAFIIFRNYRAKVKINKILDKQKAQIESLLLNILPEKIAVELQQSGKATPRSYDSVSVLFTDFKDFTKISSRLSPDELVADLNEYFMAFDAITGKYNLEKIKTIGDAYMCAGGLPVENTTHPFDAVNAAIEMVDFMKRKKEEYSSNGKIPWEIRIGIHTGPIMAGVVGKRKYAYDIWGSTVNVASRMESSGQAGKINISEATYLLVKEAYRFHHRGKVMAKNVGEVDMYFVEKQST